jgi:hypothetical protein
VNKQELEVLLSQPDVMAWLGVSEAEVAALLTKDDERGADATEATQQSGAGSEIV